MGRKPYIVNGREMILYTIGELCTRLERQHQTLRKWERANVMPPAQYRSKTGRRLYTLAQVEAIVAAVEKYKIKQGVPIPAGFIEDVYRAFSIASKEK